MKVKKQNLFLLACFVWMIAGFNILKIGISSYSSYITFFNIVLSILIFVIFQNMVFGKLVKKHTRRIQAYENELQPFYNFFDIPSFIIMVCMMTLGMVLRSLPYIPKLFIAVFYSGLGASLFLAGILFGFQYFTNKRKRG